MHEKPLSNQQISVSLCVYSLLVNILFANSTELATKHNKSTEKEKNSFKQTENMLFR